jgi:methylphosphotriester-DNA--protein-cysteine methyltransferase
VLLEILPPTAAPFVQYAAREIGVDRKTLFNWLQQVGDVTPREFLNWVRLAIAVAALEQTSRSAERIALEMGFASGTSFRNMLHRYTGRTTREARRPGSFDALLRTLSLRLSTALSDTAKHAEASPMAYDTRRPA